MCARRHNSDDNSVHKSWNQTDIESEYKKVSIKGFDYLSSHSAKN